MRLDSVLADVRLSHRLVAHFAQHVRDRIQHRQQQFVARCARQLPMELEVELACRGQVALLQAALLVIADLAQPLQVFWPSRAVPRALLSAPRRPCALR